MVYDMDDGRNLYPCPKCGAGRGGLRNPCPNCDWVPEPITTNTQLNMRNNNSSRAMLVMAFVAIVLNLLMTLLSYLTQPPFTGPAPQGPTFTAILAYPFLAVGIVACVLSTISLSLSCFAYNKGAILFAGASLAIGILMVVFRLENIVFFFVR